MRIEIGKTPYDAHVYTDDGKDITQDLRIRAINLEVTADSLPLVTLTCYPSGIVIEGATVISEVTPEPKPDKNKSAGAILGKFKVKNADIHSD